MCANLKPLKLAAGLLQFAWKERGNAEYVVKHSSYWFVYYAKFKLQILFRFAQNYIDILLPLFLAN